LKNRSHAAHFSVFTANLIYGANYTIAKNVMPEYIKPFAFIVIRVVITAILFFIVGLFLKNDKIEKSDYKRIIICAFFGVAVNQLLFFKGLDLTTPINAALMMTTNPIMVLIAAGIIIKERITVRRVSGIVIGIAGASSLLLYGKSVSISAASVTGDFFVLINSLSFGVFLIMVKPLMQKYNALLVMKWVFIAGSFMVIPFGFGELQQVQWEQFDSSIWWSVAYVVIGVTSIAYVLNTIALKKLSPPTVSAYIYLQPLFAAFFAMLTGRDSLNMLHLVAAVLIFTGVYLVSSQPRNSNAAALK
jgi:drug/metabolite transporter (DMT)-like permease